MNARQPGRRPGAPDTRTEILEAARSVFAENGFDRATLRLIAAEAGVDPALIHHYFGNKDQLFAASIDIPDAATDRVLGLLVDDPADLGRHLAETFFSIWEQEEPRTALLGILRSAMGGEDQAVEAFRQFLTSVMMAQLAPKIAGEDARLRALLMASQLVGVAMTRYVMRLEPIASAPIDDVIDLVAPRLQSYVDEDFA
ncbi:MAG TPA: TetR family transcriptional regulator [Acidimicrobiia bacterium]|nr:TetR family transcriptional regulator [Acidimicrobiia bacterium]